MDDAFFETLLYEEILFRPLLDLFSFAVSLSISTFDFGFIFGFSG
jgi:hypothetical protein